MNSTRMGPEGYHESTVEWMRGQQITAGSDLSIRSFIFGDEAHFKAPQTVENWIHPYLTAYSLKPLDGFLASIPLGKVWGQSGAVLSPDGKLLADVSPEYDDAIHAVVGGAQHPIFRRWTHHEPIHVRGTAAALAFCGGYNYFHWMYDVIARWGMLIESGVSPDHVILNANPYRPFVEQTLAMLGIPEEMVIRTHPGIYLEAEQLIVPSVIMASNYPKWATGMLRKLFLPHQNQTCPELEQIYICRKRASVRRVINEPQITDFLSGLGFHSLMLEDFTVAEQIRLFASARVIVAPHGAGLSNLAFCESGTKVIEIFHPGHIMPTYWMISNHNELDYYLMYGQRQQVHGIDFAGLEDISVDIETLKRTLRLAGTE